MPDGRGSPSPEPLVLLPGLLCDATAWAPQVAAFADERPVSVVDYGMADSLDAMADVVLEQAPARFALAGHSMGGRVALEVIARAPERVTRLALFDTGTHGVRPGEAEARRALLTLGEANGMAALVDRWFPPMVADERRDDDAFMTPLRGMAMRPGVRGYARQIAALLGRRDARVVLAGIAVPTLVGVGELDGWSPPSQHEAIAAAVIGAELVVFPGSGHMAPVETPEAVNQAIHAWLPR